jgi:4-amino-4-deoxy-L-arabinose transferase-like glycosyltransferase
MKYTPSPPNENPKRGLFRSPFPTDVANLDTTEQPVAEQQRVPHHPKSKSLWGRAMWWTEDNEQATLRTLAVDMSDFDTMRYRAMESGSNGKPARGRARLRTEWLTVGLLLVIAFLARWYAALHAGLEVDEPIYHNAAVQLLQYGIPSIRPAYQHPLTPFLYHPPFFFFLLAGWFSIFNNTSYLTGRMFSIFVSCVMMLELYLILRRMSGRVTALLALAFLTGDLWLIFTNQAIYLENSLMILIVTAIWAYWRATSGVFVSRWRELAWYALAGVLVGFVIVYKQVGGSILLAILLHLLIFRKRWLQHGLLLLMALLVIACYALAMHEIFGRFYDSATVDQVYRTLGKKAAPGLNDSPLVALQAFASRYWMFFITLLTLICGFIVSIIRYLQAFFRRKQIAQPLLTSWALGGMLFAAGISLKSPHYLILWLVPLYAVLAQELGAFILSWNWRILFPGARPRQAQALSFLVIFCLLFSIGNSLGFQARFVNQSGDALQQAEIYINTTLPSTAIVVTENYIGVDLVPSFLDISLVNTPRLVAQSRVTHLALYWTQTQPIPKSLGSVDSYCVSLHTFVGFKDHIEVCQINTVALQALLASSSSTP